MSKHIRLLAILLMLMVAAVSTQNADPSKLPLVQPAELQSVGAFKVPDSASNGEYLSFGGGSIAFNPLKNSLFISSYNGKVAEISIPADLSVATYLQPFTDVMEGRLSQVASSGAGLAGLAVFGDRLVGTASIFFDAGNTQVLTHFSHSTTLTQASFSGWSRVGELKRAGFTSGWMTALPSEWQAKLGGPALTGQCCLPIESRTSAGPSAFAFDPAKVGQAVVPVVPLLHYGDGHTTLGPWEGSNPTYGATTQMGGMAAIAGTRTILYFGRNGLGVHCYGNGTAEKSLVGTIGPDKEKYCYDPTTNTKGSHAYPYRYQVWAYDLNDFAAVKAGNKKPWDVKPYGVWPLTLLNPNLHVGGVGYDAQRQLLYVVEISGDKVRGDLPLIHVFKLAIGAGPAAPPPVVPPVAEPPPTPAPTPVAVPVSTPIPPATPDVDPKVLDLEARIATIKALIQEALNNTTAVKAVTPLKEALKK
jgi:hypothetical protein